MKLLNKIKFFFIILVILILNINCCLSQYNIIYNKNKIIENIKKKKYILSIKNIEFLLNNQIFYIKNEKIQLIKILIYLYYKNYNINISYYKIYYLINKNNHILKNNKYIIFIKGLINIKKFENNYKNNIDLYKDKNIYNIELSFKYYKKIVENYYNSIYYNISLIRLHHILYIMNKYKNK